MIKVLLDTCIVIDALQSREPFAQSAQNIFLATATDQCQAFLTAKEITDIYFLAHHALHSKESTEQVISKLFSLFTILDTTAEDVEQAIALPLSDYEDGVMVETAIREKMDCLVTRNLKGYQKAPFTIYSPEEFLTHINYEAPSEN